MSNNISINTNQNPYYDDFDDSKNFHQVLYKPSLPVQARELTTQQSILRDQLKKFGDHVFQNGSKVTGGDFVLNLDYEYVKLKPQYNGVNITVGNFATKTICGVQSGTKALVINTVAANSTTGDPDTLFVKYISGGSVTDKVQGISVDTAGSQYSSVPLVNITGGGATSILGADIVTRNLKATGLSTFVGQSEFDGNAKFDSTITAGGSAGSNGQYLKTTGSGVEWASFPTLRTRQTFTASAGQTAFSFSYTINFIYVFVNGIKLTDAEFTATNGSTVVLAVGCFVGDIVELVGYNPISVGSASGSLNNIVCVDIINLHNISFHISDCNIIISIPFSIYQFEKFIQFHILTPYRYNQRFCLCS